MPGKPPIVVAAGVAIALAMSPHPSVAQAAVISVGPNVQVSLQNAKRFHGEVDAAADPADPNHLIACSYVGAKSDGMFGTSHIITYVSFDGGKTWQPGIEHQPFAGDASCALGRDGLALFAGIGGPVDSEDEFDYKNAYVYRSTDGGRTWDAKPQLFPAGDRDFFDVDTVSEKFSNRVYFHEENKAKTLDGVMMYGMGVFHSTDNAATFSPIVRTASSTRAVQVVNSAVLTDGTLVVEMYRTVPDAKEGDGNYTTSVQVMRSIDGGLSFSDPVTVTDWTGQLESMNTAYAFPFIAADTSHGPYNNRLYVAWPDTRYGHGNILIVHSDDVGKTWSKPLVVDDIPTPGKGPDASDSNIAVNRDGVVGVTWYDGRGVTGGSGGYVRFAASYDGGETFTPSVVVSRAPSSMSPTNVMSIDAFTWGGGKPKQKGGPLQANAGPDKRFGVSGGDMMGLAAGADGVFHPVWTGDGTGVAQLWTAAVTANGSAIKNGDPSLANFNDVTKQFAIRLTNATYDRNNQTVSIDAQLSNTSKTAITGPVKLRVISLTSVLGTPTLVNSENAQSSRGAIVTFAPAAGSTVTRPGAQTQWRRLTFKISNRHRFSPDPGNGIDEYISMGARAFAQP